MDKEVLWLMWLKKRMKKRFTLIHNWLREAEKDYEKNRKEEGELNLLLAQAEVKRAWELSCQESAFPEKPKVGGKLNGFSWKIIGACCLSAFLIAFGIFHFPFSNKAPTASQNELSVKPLRSVVTVEEEEKKAVSPIEPRQEQKLEQQPSTIVQNKDQVHPGQKVVPQKEIQVKEQPVHTQESSKPIEVDVVDLVQEAQRTLYQPNGGQVQH